MSRTLATAAQGSGSIAGTISAVARAAERTDDGAERTERAAGAVAEVSTTLDRHLAAFRF